MRTLCKKDNKLFKQNFAQKYLVEKKSQYFLSQLSFHSKLNNTIDKQINEPECYYKNVPFI